MNTIEKKIRIDETEQISIFGSNDKFLKKIENKFQSIIVVRGESVSIKGENEEVKSIASIFKEMQYMLQRNGSITENDFDTILKLLDIHAKNPIDMPTILHDNVVYNGVKDKIKARSARQIEYFEKVLKNDLVFSIGPAGTGKTYLAVAMALAALRNNEVSRIILSRPAVEAGESLGFLPGDLTEKIDPYMRPLTDALHDMLSGEKLKILFEKKTIEITPLAYMRGRTLNNSFIILDEAQNATITQMKMFLTRLGSNSKAIITGDITQIDLVRNDMSGLINAKKVLTGIKGIEFVEFENKDIVRHHLVARILKAYEKEEKRK